METKPKQMIRELPTQDPSFSRAFVKSIHTLDQQDLQQMEDYFKRLSTHYKNSELRNQWSPVERKRVFWEITDLKYFLTLLGSNLINDKEF